MRKAILSTLLFLMPITAAAQEKSSTPADLEQLRVQLLETRSQLRETREELTASARAIEELRRDMDALRKQVQTGGAATSASGAEPVPATGEPTVAAANKDPEFLAAKVEELHQVKVESASKYPVKISGLILFNAFRNTGNVDITDLPNLAFGSNPGSTNANVGATLRQTLLGVEVRGPHVFGAESSGDISIDFAGGSPTTDFGVTNGILRMRTANVHLNWSDTTLTIGQDTPFISPLSPTSYANVAEPALSWAGNLWVWTPQIVVEHRIHTGEYSNIVLQGGIMDPLTEQEPPFQGRQPTAGEASGIPTFAGRIAYDRLNADFLPLEIGFAGTRGEQNYNMANILPVAVSGITNATNSSWTVNSDIKIPILNKAELSGEWYYGQAVGGLGGGIWNSTVVSSTTAPYFHPLRSTGGWGQLKITPIPRFEINAAMGQDENISQDAHFFVDSQSISSGFPPLIKNNARFVNVIYKPNSTLILAAEIRHLFTLPFSGPGQHANILNLAVGVKF